MSKEKKIPYKSVTDIILYFECSCGKRTELMRFPPHKEPVLVIEPDYKEEEWLEHPLLIVECSHCGRTVTLGLYRAIDSQFA